jgi:hypothetical protein
VHFRPLNPLIRRRIARARTAIDTKASRYDIKAPLRLAFLVFRARHGVDTTRLLQDGDFVSAEGRESHECRLLVGGLGGDHHPGPGVAESIAAGSTKRAARKIAGRNTDRNMNLQL